MGSPSFLSDDRKAGLAALWPGAFVPEKKGRHGASLLSCSFHFTGVEGVTAFHLALTPVLPTAPQGYPVLKVTSAKYE